MLVQIWRLTYHIVQPYLWVISSKYHYHFSRKFFNPKNDTSIWVPFHNPLFCYIVVVFSEVIPDLDWCSVFKLVKQLYIGIISSSICHFFKYFYKAVSYSLRNTHLWNRYVPFEWFQLVYQKLYPRKIYFICLLPCNIFATYSLSLGLLYSFL